MCNLEKKYDLTVDEISMLLVERAQRILEDGIMMEREHRASRRNKKK